MNNQIIDPATVKISTIFYSSWGYEQTNITFYILVRKSGKALYLRKLDNAPASNDPGIHSMSGKVIPKLDTFKSEEFRKIMKTPKEHIRHGSALLYLWDGAAKHCSWYH